MQIPNLGINNLYLKKKIFPRPKHFQELLNCLVPIKPSFGKGLYGLVSSAPIRINKKERKTLESGLES